MPAGYTDKFPGVSKDPAKKAQYKKERKRKELIAWQYHPSKLLPGMHHAVNEEEGDDNKVVPIKSRTEKLFSVLAGRDPTPDERKKLRMSVSDFIKKYPSSPPKRIEPTKKMPSKETGKVLQFKPKIIPFEPWGKAPPPKKGN